MIGVCVKSPYVPKQQTPDDTTPIGATGLEPVTKKSQADTNKQLTGKSKMTTAQKLPKDSNSCQESIAQNDTVLQEIITVWPKLPKHIRETIKLLAKPYGH
jgi:hypothetical protein